MVEEKKNIPKVRFREFAGDDANAWELRKLGNISKTKRGLTYKPSNIDNTGIRVLRSSNIKEDTFVISDDDVFVKESAVNIPFVENGDILITAANGSTNLVGKHAIIRDIPKNSAVHGGFMLITTSKEYEFLNALMSSNWYKKFIKKYVVGGNGAIGNLRKNDLDNQKIYVPKKDEQKKIGNFFKMLDSLITLHQRELDNYKMLKKTMLSKMFPKNDEKYPEIRFTGFAYAWEQRKLREVANHRGGTAIEKYFDKNGQYKVISIGSYGLDGKYIDQNIRAISNKITDERVVHAGELTMVLNDKTANGTIIGRSLLIEQDNKYVVNQRTEIIAPKVIFDSKFAFTILNGSFREKVKRIIQGGTQIYVNYSAVENLSIELPDIEEQQKIGDFFKHLDELITLHQRKRHD